MNIHPLFPAAAVSIEDSSFSLTEKEKEVIWSHKMDDAHNYYNCYSSYSGRILDDRKLKRFKKFCQGHLDNYVSEIMKCKNKAKITNSWANYSFTGNNHAPHTHSNSVVSGIYYVQVEDSVPFIEFEHVGPRYLVQFPMTEETIFNSNVYNINVKNGMLVIFPSHIRHSVPRNDSKQWRISVAFNSFLLGDLNSGGFDELRIKDA